MSGLPRQIDTVAMLVYPGGRDATVHNIRLVFLPGATPDKDQFDAHVVAPGSSQDGLRIKFWRVELERAVTSGVPSA
jgi:hypothetical protein